MKVLVIGSGGREHAICKKLAESPKVTSLFCAPGNAGIAGIAECINIKPMDFDGIISFAKQQSIDFVFVAPDDPLAGGLVNRLREEGIKTFGPTMEAAIIEGSKAFSKEFMIRHGIPTAMYQTFDNYEDAMQYLQNKATFPIVIKADGLALGKGVLICETKEKALEALKNMMLDKVFGRAGNKVVIEEFLQGSELTVLAFTDGITTKLMPSSQDHKKALDGDKGLNTGGMGAFSPASCYSPELEQEIIETVVKPTISGLNDENRTFTGVIYFGLMNTSEGIKVIEYNARFGDPETEVVLPLLKTDLMDIIIAVDEQRLNEIEIEWKSKVGFGVIIASAGYPGQITKGCEIKIGDLSDDMILYHCGTALGEGKLVTNGGRVFCLSTVADTIDEARKKVYSEIKKISFEGARYRTDIGIK